MTHLKCDASSAIHDDPVTVIDEKRTYNVKAPARHPIYENFRVKVRLLFIL